MKTWWLAIDKKWTSYLELKNRRVVAQGWPRLGDLKILCDLVTNSDNRDLFQKSIIELGNGLYETHKFPKVMWTLLRIRKNDLVVGIEGQKVKGICQMTQNAWESYHYDNKNKYNYIQTVGAPVEWIDWDSNIFGFTPIAPAQSVPGIAGLVKDHQAVVNAWNKYKQIRP